MESKIRKCIVLVLVMVISPAVVHADVTAGLASHWKLDETSGPTAYNSTSGNNGTLHNGPVWRSSGGKFDGALSFDEVNDYVTITDFDYTNSSDEFSLCFWFKIDDIAGTGFQYMLSHGNVSSDNSLNVYFMESDYTDGDIAGKIRTKLVLNGGSSWYGTAPSATLADGNWHMYAITLSSVDGTSIYIDGELATANAGLKGAFNPATSIYLGARCDLDTSRYYGNSSVDDGLLDDVRIYNRVLSDTEINDIGNFDPDVRPCDFRIRGDFNWDCYIDFNDFISMATEWLTYSDTVDLTYDDYVDIEDFADFAVNWLTCNNADNPNCDGKAGIDINYPGGNILVDQVVGDTVSVQQDIRDTGGWWFYWNFRVWGAEGRTLSFQFTNGNPIGLRGPAVSTDQGATWSWMGATGGAYFNYAFAEDEEEVRFCFTIPYQESDLVQFLDRHSGNPNLSVEEHCLTRKGRSVRRLFLGKLDAEPTYRVQLTCRHHSCETTASYAFEGILEEILADTNDGQWFRQNVEVLAIPFMDKDGVEDGDQGKNRLPHDHNRDYVGESIYPSVAAIREFVPTWSNGKLRLTLDMHSPSKNETHIFFYVDNTNPFRQNCDEFCQILESEQSGPLVYYTSNNVYSAPLPEMNRGWCSTLPGVLVPITLEFPYATADGNVVTAESARAFGHDIAHAIRQYLQQQP